MAEGRVATAAVRDSAEGHRRRILGVARAASAGLAALTILLWTLVPGLHGHDLGLVAAGAMLSIPHGGVDYLLPQSDSWRPVASARLRLVADARVREVRAAGLGGAGVHRARLLRIMVVGTTATVVLAAVLVAVLALVHSASGWAGPRAFRLGD
ncbi:MAG TPA: hypothetical protein VGS19_20435 [Streptosporangiaceae bacterium]|nr:hypothetical protein [Streptosporangiaceae bacterium]